MKICINAGHCATVDMGAHGFGLYEAEVAREIGKLVQKNLIDAGKEVKFVQTDSLQGICDAANDWGADFFVSIHCNASGVGRAHGTETYFYPGSFKGRNLAFSVQREIVRQLETNNRGLKMAYFYVLKHTAMPAILVETAFIDNINDNKLLKERRADFARAITDGILNYLKTIF